MLPALANLDAHYRYALIDYSLMLLLDFLVSCCSCSSNLFSLQILKTVLFFIFYTSM